METLAWLERTGLGIWVRESLLGFPLTLIFHSLGMGFLVGVHVVIALRLFGLAPALPPALLTRLFPLMWFSFGVSLLSGLLLLLAYPAKAFTNPVFYLKFLFIIAAFVLARHLTRRYLLPETPEAVRVTGRTRLLAALSLCLWAGAITSGRLLAYTYSVLTVGG